MRVALVGTGALGLASAKRLLAAGVPLVVFNRTRAAAAPLEPLGARVARDMSEVARSADCIVFSVRGARPIEEMLDAIGGAKIDGKTIVSLGLIGRRQARALDRRVRREGGAYLNVSPCGTRREAEKGALVLVAGGSRATLRRCEPILAPLGTVLYAGDVGASATAGLAATVLSFANVTAFCHAVANLRRSGAPPEALLEALGQSAPFVDAGGFLRTYLAPSPEPVSARDRNRIRRLLRDAVRGARANAVSDLAFRAVRDELRRAPIDDVARFVRLAWPAGGDFLRDEGILAKSLFQLAASAFAAYAVARRMLEAEGVPMAVLARAIERSPVLGASYPLFLAAYFGRLSLRNFGSPLSTLDVIAEELRQLRSTLRSLGVESPLPRALARLARSAIDQGLGQADFFAVNFAIDPPSYSDAKKRALASNCRHVNAGRVGFFLSAGMDFVMGKREGCYLHDIDGGVSLFDAHCNGGVFNLGHRNPEIAAALRSALDSLDIGNHHLLSAQRGELAERLAALLPGDISRVVFGVSGGEAIDLAIKLARAFTRRKKVLFARGGYHGHTGLAVFAGDPRFFEDFSERSPDYEEVALQSISSLREKLDAGVAAVLYETVPASVGLPVPPAGFYAEVRRACDEAGALLIIDEVQTGWGRSGKLWAIEHYGVVPDIMVLGKGMSAGHYPMSAVCFRPHLGGYLTRDSFRHQSTMGGAEIGCAVVLKQLDILTAQGFLPHVRRMADAFTGALEQLRSRNADVLVEVRQLGLLMGLVYAHPELGPLMTRCAYDEGLLLVFAGLDPRVSQLLPPLTITREQVELVVQKLERAIARARNIFQMMR
jgi:putrescine aminotransferase